MFVRCGSLAGAHAPAGRGAHGTATAAGLGAGTTGGSPGAVPGYATTPKWWPRPLCRPVGEAQRLLWCPCSAPVADTRWNPTTRRRQKGQCGGFLSCRVRLRAHSRHSLCWQAAKATSTCAMASGGSVQGAANGGHAVNSQARSQPTGHQSTQHRTPMRLAMPHASKPQAVQGKCGGAPQQGSPQHPGTRRTPRPRPRHRSRWWGCTAPARCKGKGATTGADGLPSRAGQGRRWQARHFSSARSAAAVPLGAQRLGRR